MAGKQEVDSSTGIVLKTILILLGIWFLYFVRDIIALVFIAIVIVSAIDPIIIWMQKRRIRRSIGVMSVYILLFLLVGFSFSFLIPPVVGQFKDFSQRLSDYSGQIGETFQGLNIFFENQNIDSQAVFQDFSRSLAGISGEIFSTTVGIFSGLVAVAIVFVMAFYMAVKENGIKQFIISITPQRHKEYAASLTDRIKLKIGRWLLGELVLMFAIFILTFLGLTVLGVPYALSLAIIAGLLEIIPYIGPMLSAIPAIIIAFTVSPLTGFLVLVLYVLIQQFENHIIVPQVMRRAVGLHPVAVILALLIGFKLGGVLGAILAVPVATAISVFVGDLFEKPKEI